MEPGVYPKHIHSPQTIFGRLHQVLALINFLNSVIIVERDRHAL